MITMTLEAPPTVRRSVWEHIRTRHFSVCGLVSWSFCSDCSRAFNTDVSKHNEGKAGKKLSPPIRCLECAKELMWSVWFDYRGRSNTNLSGKEYGGDGKPGVLQRVAKKYNRSNDEDSLFDIDVILQKCERTPREFILRGLKRATEASAVSREKGYRAVSYQADPLNELGVKDDE